MKKEYYIIYDKATSAVYIQLGVNMKKTYLYFSKSAAEQDAQYFMNTEKGKREQRNLLVKKVLI